MENGVRCARWWHERRQQARLRSVIEWKGGAGIGDTLDISLGVSRWGNSSFDVGFTGVVGDRPVFTATITYVGVSPGDHKPMPMPDDVRAALS